MENWLEQAKSDSGYHTWSEAWTAEEVMAAETKDNEHREETTEKSVVSSQLGHSTQWHQWRSLHTVTPVTVTPHSDTSDGHSTQWHQWRSLHTVTPVTVTPHSGTSDGHSTQWHQWRSFHTVTVTPYSDTSDDSNSQ